MSWFSLGAPTTKKECKKPCCENKHGHSHGGQQQQQIPPQICREDPLTSHLTPHTTHASSYHTPSFTLQITICT